MAALGVVRAMSSRSQTTQPSAAVGRWGPTATVVGYNRLENAAGRTVTRVDIVQDAEIARNSRFRVLLQDGAIQVIVHAVLMARGWSTTGPVRPNCVPRCVRDEVLDQLEAAAWDAIVPGDHDYQEVSR